MADRLPNAANLSGSITLGGTAQALAAANVARRGLLIQNVSAGDLWVSPFGNAAVGAAGSFKIVAGGLWNVVHANALTIIGATTGQLFTAIEY